MRTVRLAAAVVTVAAIVAAAAVAPAWSQSSEPVLYRCPGNDYNNTLSPAEAEKLRCKRVESKVTIIPSGGASAPVPSTIPTTAAAVPAGTSAITPADSAALRARASSARRALEAKLRSEEVNLRVLEDRFNGGEPERRVDEHDFQKYLDRVASMRTAIARKQIDIAELRRELDRLPAQ